MNHTILLRCGSCRAINRVPETKKLQRPVCGKCGTSLDYPKGPVTATALTYEHEVSDWPGLLMIEFYDQFCVYCQKIEPVANDIAARRAVFLKAVKIDILVEHGIARRFTVNATPAFILFRNRRLLQRLDGAPQEFDDLEKWIVLNTNRP
jgi:thioredoxin 2